MRSLDNGASFDDANIVHLTDLMLLGIDAYPEGPDQIPAGLTVDPCGGVQILWYQTADTANGEPGIGLHVFWARITDIGGPNQAIEVACLTTQSFPVGTVADPVFLGERQSLASAQRGIQGLWGLACYSLVQDGAVDTVVQRVKSDFGPCSGDASDDPPDPPASIDANVNGLIDPGDPAAYLDNWSQGWPSTDLDGDGDVDSDDFVLFVQRYDEHNVE